MDSNLGSQIVIAAVSSTLIQWAKNWTKIPWITQHTAGINRAAAIIVSGIGALGMHFSYSHEAGTLTLTGLTLHTILTNLWTWAQQFAIQHGWYQLVTKPVPSQP